MNKICKEYVLEIKAMFPIRRKQERIYIKSLISDIESFCEEANVETKKDLYNKYGLPNDVVNNYLSTLNTTHIAKHIKTTRFIKILLIALLVLATIATSALCISFYHEYQAQEQEQAMFYEEIITEYN